MELLIVISIIAIVTVIGVVSYTSINKRSRDAKRKADIEQIRSALEMYRSDFGTYPVCSALPTSFSDASCLGEASMAQFAPYIAKIPTDPKTPTYYYMYKTGSAAPANSYQIAAVLESELPAVNSTCPTLPTFPDPAVTMYCLKNP